MKNAFKLKYIMYLVMIDYINSNITKFKDIPGFVEKFELFKIAIGEITTNQAKQLSNNTGVTKEKQLIRENLADFGLEISKKLFGYAIYSNNLELQKEIKYVKTDFLKADESELAAMCLKIHSCGIKELINLDNFGIKTVDLEKLNNLIIKFNNSIPKTKETKTDRKTITKIISDNFEIAEKLLYELDALAEVISVSESMLINKYRESRMIVNVGKSKLTLKTKIKDSISNEGIANVDVVIVNSKTGEKFIKKTSKGGGFTISNMPKGVYEAKIEKLGYKSQTQSLNIITGETSELDILLEKE